MNAGTRLSALNPRVTRRRTGALPEGSRYLSVVYSVVKKILGAAWLRTSQTRVGGGVARRSQGGRRDLHMMEIHAPHQETTTCPTVPYHARSGDVLPLDGLGLEVTGRRLEPDRAVLACRVVDDDQWCRRCGCEACTTWSRAGPAAHEPFGWRPTRRC